MDGQRLKDYFKKENLLNTLVLIVSSIIILAGAVFVVVYHETFLALIPGFYQFEKYQDDLSQRNDLVDENNFLLSENALLTESITQLGTSQEDIDKKYSLIEEIQKKQQKMLKNLNEAISLDTKMRKLRLLADIHKYVVLLEEVDQKSKETRNKELSISEKRLMYYEFQRDDAKFNDCVSAINRQNYSYSSAAEKQVAESINKCFESLDKAKSTLNKLEKDIEKDLPLTTSYLELSENFWKNSYEFHKQLGEDKVGEAEKYNKKAAEYKREIVDLDLEAIFAEFNNLILGDLLKEVTDLMEETEELQNEADDFFEKNLA